MVALVLVLPLKAQVIDGEDYERYVDAAGDALILLRGRAAVNYMSAYNGTYFMEYPQFSLGELRYNGKRYHNVFLNVDAVRQDLLVRQAEGIAQVLLTKDCVEWFTMGERRFINLEKYVPSAPEGYFEVLFDGEYKFYKQMRKSLEKDLNGNMEHLTGAYRDNYSAYVHNTFVLKELWYCLTPSGNLERIRNKDSFLSLLPKSDRKSITKAINKRTGSLEDFVVNSLKYLENR